METINRPETIAMPMLRVECLVDDTDNMEEEGWPKFVQCLPPLGALMESDKNFSRAYVRRHLFRADGVIELWLTDKAPN
jgi:hypothetical protein